jgi:hypothetical protein
MVVLFVEEARLTIMSPLHNVQWDSIEMDTAAAWHATSLAEIEPGPFWPWAAIVANHKYIVLVLYSARTIGVRRTVQLVGKRLPKPFY